MSEHSSFLTGIRFWVNRIKLDKNFTLLLALINDTTIFILYCIISPEYFFVETNFFFVLIIYISCGFIYLHIIRKIPSNFQELIISNNFLFKSDKIYNNYVSYVTKTFKSKTELIFPLIGAICVSFMWAWMYGFSMNFEALYIGMGVQPIIIPKEYIILNIIGVTLTSLALFIVIIILGSAIFLIYFTYKLRIQKKLSTGWLRVTRYPIVIDCTKAKRDLGWKPVYDTLGASKRNREEMEKQEKDI